MSFWELAAYCVGLGLLELENMQAGQFMLSRPSVVGALIGLLTGRLVEGARMGVFLELLFLDQAPMGGIIPPSGLVAAGAGVLLMAGAGLEFSMAFALSILLGYAYSRLQLPLRNMRNSWNGKIDAAADRGKTDLSGWIVKALVSETAACTVLLLAGIPVAATAGNWLWNNGPGQIRSALVFACSTAPWLGMAALLFRFKPRLSAGER
ncbi:MAG: PTS sugar transporter subunit IIC [bacterium]